MAFDETFSSVATNVSSSSTVLMDDNTFLVSEHISVGMTIENVTDGSTAEILTIDGDHQLTTSSLSGGSDNLWELGDLYTVSLNTSTVVSSDLNIIYTVSIILSFSTRIIDARKRARQRNYTSNRHGVVALYRNVYDAPNRDIYHGVGSSKVAPFILERNPSGVQTQYKRDEPQAINTGVLYGPVQEIHLLYFSPTEQTTQSPWGLITTGQAVAVAPLVYPFRRGDLFKIQNKVWTVQEIPRFEYSRGREIIGYTMLLVDDKVAQVKW